MAALRKVIVKHKLSKQLLYFKGYLKKLMIYKHDNYEDIKEQVKLNRRGKLFAKLDFLCGMYRPFLFH